MLANNIAEETRALRRSASNDRDRNVRDKWRERAVDEKRRLLKYT